jgi:hypothetical protein
MHDALQSTHYNLRTTNYAQQILQATHYFLLTTNYAQQTMHVKLRTHMYEHRFKLR